MNWNLSASKRFSWINIKRMNLRSCIEIWNWPSRELRNLFLLFFCAFIRAKCFITMKRFSRKWTDSFAFTITCSWSTRPFRKPPPPLGHLGPCWRRNFPKLIVYFRVCKSLGNKIRLRKRNDVDPSWLDITWFILVLAQSCEVP